MNPGVNINGVVRVCESNLSSLSVNGCANIIRVAYMQDVQIVGKLTSLSLTTKSLNIKGYISTEGNILAETININGGCNITGLMQAASSELFIKSVSSISDMKSDEIKIKGCRKNYLKCNSINGEKICVDHVIAHKVCGEEVNVGPLCTIDLLIYKTNYTIDKTSVVEKIIKNKG